MNFLTIFLTSLGLAMDAFVVSIGGGIALKKNLKIKDAIIIATFFGLFQFFMPILGWTCGLLFRDFILNFDHWIAFGLLALIGSKMIYESLNDESEESVDFRSFSVLLTLAIATSIDALAVGLSFSVLKTPIITASSIIGIITFFLCVLGVFIGEKFGHLFDKQAEIIGGLILICIGTKILLEHLQIL